MEWVCQWEGPTSGGGYVHSYVGDKVPWASHYRVCQLYVQWSSALAPLCLLRHLVYCMTALCGVPRGGEGLAH